ncbi:MAG: tetratricopeptide repeat protein [Spirochaetota bacterium]|nr:MAG: tetratricopeptide repeat protein [Spirochaetota bacterium]
MKKALLIILAVVLVGGGLYGSYYFYQLQKAETQINEAILSIHEGDYIAAAQGLKDVVAMYDYRIVKAPALYLLAVVYERLEKYSSAEDAYKILISDNQLQDVHNWYTQSLISLSKLYRKGFVKSSLSQKVTLINLINAINGEIKIIEETKKESRWTFTDMVKHAFNQILAINYNINVEEVTDEKILEELKTELGFLYLETNDCSKALMLFKELDSPLSKFGLAKVYFAMQNYRKGLETLKELITYDTTGKIQQYYINELFNYAEAMYEEKQYNEAIDLFTIVARDAPNTKYAEQSLYYLAKYYYNTHNNRKSLIYIDQILSNAINTKDEESFLLKGYIYYDKREFLKALKVFKDFIKTYPYSEMLNTAREWKAMTERSLKYLG